ncbi:MAG: DUF2490 domain-containing protein [Algoriphagus sp.]|uniref:DUF2490 domain-containing protein n=1 Tax=Algoriphagus sp. TaxID=1872435 RepID=UPI00261B999C|nr:DUF2490 domain-containing protein [Algoriphagus sp.]MDG1276280.1 DUF2490 domain-containing protein [Algoriphagus sp.]
MKTSSPNILRNITKSFVGVIFILLSNPTFSQKKIINTSQQWIQSYNEAKLTCRWTIMLDGGIRWKEGFSQKTSFIVRGGIGYLISPKVMVAAGFAHVGIYSEELVILQEFRPYQEISYKTNLGKVGLSQRFRLEEQFFKDKSNLSLFSDLGFNYRFRYSVMLGIPLFGLSSKNHDRKLILNVGDEIFLKAGKQISSRVFDKNRFIISPTVQWNKELSFAFTYNLQFTTSIIPEEFVLSQVAWLQVKYSLDFTSSKAKH